MRSKLLALTLVAALIAALMVPVVGAAGRVEQGGGVPIRLKAGTFWPSRGETLQVAPGLSLDRIAVNQRGYYLVQFSGPVQQAWKDRVAMLGAELLEYVPDYAFKARMTPLTARIVQRDANVAWVGGFQPAYKLSPNLNRSGAVNLYRVSIERGADAAQTAAALAATGAQVVRGDGASFVVAANSAQVDAAARVLDVAWVENFAFHEKHNEYGGGAIMGASTAHAAGYNGSSQIAAVADTGLGGGTASTAHADLPSSRVTAIQNFTAANAPGCYTVLGDGAQDVDSGHGTHTALSVVSDGRPDGSGTGTAPAAKLVFQSVEDYLDLTGSCSVGNPDGYYLIGIPTDLHNLYQPAYNSGARVHSNSWGSNAAGDYTTDSANTDDFIWDNPDMTITFSAGNEGTDANANGVVDNDSIGSPATAKNVITVGASENDRQGHYECDTGLTYQSHDAYQPSTTCSGMSGNNLLGTYGQRWPADYPANPLFSDSTAGNAGQMASFSSRGPTDDTRIKPDVVAPGTWVLSGYSSLYQEGYGDPTNPRNGLFQVDGWGMPRNVDYKYFGGTSMSNPLTAGAAVVVRDFYSKTAGLNASAALVKATLINSAVDMADENNDGANDNDFPIPNVHEGWGRVNMANATDGGAKYYDATSGVSTGNALNFSVTTSGGAPLKVSLVWSDFASTAAASVNLVNDLDLEVTSPSATLYRGNVFSGGWSATGGSADRRNNVENVYVQSAAAGTWTVTVRGFNVPQGPQRYALVVDGATTLTPPAAPTSTGLQNPTTNASETGGDNNGYQTNPANANTDNATFAVDTNSGSGTSTSCTSTQKDKHRYYNYNFSVTSGSTINGIQVRLDARADATGGSPRICVQLSWNGGTSWTTAKTSANLTTSEATYLLGSSSDNWGHTWTTSELSNANFRVRVVNVASNTSRDFSLDWVAVNVTYTAP